MKKIFTLLVMVALATCWMSCSDDDKDEPDPTIPTMNEITLTIKIGDNKSLELFWSEFLPNDNPETWLEDEKEYESLKPYYKIPQDWEVNWGDGNTTNSTNHTYTTGGTYLVKIKGTGITSIALEAYDNFTLQNIDVTKAPNLVILDICEIDNAKIDKLDVSKNTALKYLNCSYTALNSLDISNNTALEFLYCHDNLLTYLNVDKNTKLKSLWCFRNKISTLNLSQIPTLQYLVCCENNLTSLDLNKNTELIYLDCEENPFTQESFNDLLNSLPMGKYDNGKPISCLWIDDKWDGSIAEEKGWIINKW